MIELLLAAVVITAPLPPELAPAGPTTNTYSLNLAWDPFDPSESAFFLIYQTNMFGQVKIMNVGQTLEATVTGLSPTNRYTFAVRAYLPFLSTQAIPSNPLLWRPPVTNYDSLFMGHGPVLGPFTNLPIVLPYTFAYTNSNEGFQLMVTRSNNLNWILSHERKE